MAAGEGMSGLAERLGSIKPWIYLQWPEFLWLFFGSSAYHSKSFLGKVCLCLLDLLKLLLIRKSSASLSLFLLVLMANMKRGGF